VPGVYNKPEFGPCAPVVATLLTDWGPINQLAKNIPAVYFSSPDGEAKTFADQHVRRSIHKDRNKTSLRYWVVKLLGMQESIPLFAEAMTLSFSAGGGMTSERPFFRAWCMECGASFHTYSEAMKWSDELPQDKHHRPTRFIPPPAEEAVGSIASANRGIGFLHPKQFTTQ